MIQCDGPLACVGLNQINLTKILVFYDQKTEKQYKKRFDKLISKNKNKDRK